MCLFHEPTCIPNPVPPISLPLKRREFEGIPVLTERYAASRRFCLPLALHWVLRRVILRTEVGILRMNPSMPGNHFGTQASHVNQSEITHFGHRTTAFAPHEQQSAVEKHVPFTGQQHSHGVAASPSAFLPQTTHNPHTQLPHPMHTDQRQQGAAGHPTHTDQRQQGAVGHHMDHRQQGAVGPPTHTFMHNNALNQHAQSHRTIQYGPPNPSVSGQPPNSCSNFTAHDVHQGRHAFGSSQHNVPPHNSGFIPAGNVYPGPLSPSLATLPPSYTPKQTYSVNAESTPPSGKRTNSKSSSKKEHITLVVFQDHTVNVILPHKVARAESIREQVKSMRVHNDRLTINGDPVSEGVLMVVGRWGPNDHPKGWSNRSKEEEKLTCHPYQVVKQFREQFTNSEDVGHVYVKWLRDDKHDLTLAQLQKCPLDPQPACPYIELPGVYDPAAVQHSLEMQFHDGFGVPSSMSSNVPTQVGYTPDPQFGSSYDQYPAPPNGNLMSPHVVHPVSSVHQTAPNVGPLAPECWSGNVMSSTHYEPPGAGGDGNNESVQPRGDWDKVLNPNTIDCMTKIEYVQSTMESNMAAIMGQISSLSALIKTKAAASPARVAKAKGSKGIKKEPGGGGGDGGGGGVTEGAVDYGTERKRKVVTPEASSDDEVDTSLFPGGCPQTAIDPEHTSDLSMADPPFPNDPVSVPSPAPVPASPSIGSRKMRRSAGKALKALQSLG